jgi:hypothetical protein
MRRLRWVYLPVFCVALVLTLAIRAGEPLPARISDNAFWALVTESSEAGGGFLSENLVSNELGYPYIIQPLMERVKPGGAYIGVGPEQNFTYISAMQPSIAFIVDIRRQNMIEHLLYKAIFEMSPNRAEFLSRLFARRPANVPPENSTIDELFSAFEGLPENPDLHRENLDTITKVLAEKHHFELNEEDRDALEHVYAEFAKYGSEVQYSVTESALRGMSLPPGFALDQARVFRLPVDPNSEIVGADSRRLTLTVVSGLLGMPFPTYAEVMKAKDSAGRNWNYLGTEESYQRVRVMHQKNLIVPLVGDFAGPKALRAVAQFLKGYDASVSVFYVSNVEQYLTPLPRLQDFYRNIAELPLNASSTFIRSAQITGPQPGLAQSSISSMQNILDAVLTGRARNWNEILQLSQ